ncbi:MAG: hypothetical protein RL145_2096 [Pseudomonadota bacterium]
MSGQPTSQRFLAALELPVGARQSTRIAKKILADQAAANSLDRRLIEQGLDDVVWAGVLKPTTIAVPAFVDEKRDWGEIAIITLSVRDSVDPMRIASLLHKAIPYPLLLVADTKSGLQISCANVRRAINNESKRVSDTPLVATILSGSMVEPFIAAWALPNLPATNMAILYGAFVARLESWLAAELTGRWDHGDSEGAIIRRREALMEHKILVSEAARLKKLAARARAMRDRVELNGKVQNCLQRLEVVKAKL